MVHNGKETNIILIIGISRGLNKFNIIFMNIFQWHIKKKEEKKFKFQSRQFLEITTLILLVKLKHYIKSKNIK